MIRGLTVESRAKINLGLRLLEKRPDGYHDIITVFQEISLADSMVFEAGGKSIRIETEDPRIPKGKDNLVWRAFRLFQEKTGVDEGVRIRLEKRIPPGGGLGGGSSNAAALLRAADRLWRTHLSPDDLFEMCGKLGSDVPFFLRGGTQIGEGRGEKLTPMQLFSNYWVVLVFPGLHISTGWAYARARIALTKDEKITTFRPLFSALDPEEWKSLLINDLEAPVFAAYPLLKEVKKELYQEGAFYAAMSGSGSTLFGLFREEKRAREVCLFFRREKDVTVRIYRPVTNDGSGLGREPDGQG